MTVDLSPGDWAGVLATLDQSAGDLDYESSHAATDADALEAHERAEDLRRIVRVIAQALAEDFAARGGTT